MTKYPTNMNYTKHYLMRKRNTPGPTKITVDLLKKWYKLSDSLEDLEIPPDEEALFNWNKFVHLVQQFIRYEDIPEAFFLGILVLIPKKIEIMSEVYGYLK